MSLDTILAAFAAPGRIPEDALRAAVAQAPALVPAVTAAVEHAAGNATLLPAQESVVFYGLAAMAAARQTALYRPYLRLLALPDGRLAPYGGGDFLAFQASVLVSLFDGDETSLLTAIEDRAFSGAAKWSLFLAGARLVADGRVARAPFVDLLGRFDRDEMALPDDFAWVGWQEAIRCLGLADMAGRVRAGWESGRMGAPEDDGDDTWSEGLAWTAAHPGAMSAFDEEGVSPVDDPVAFVAGPIEELTADALARLEDEIAAGRIDAGPEDLEAMRQQMLYNPEAMFLGARNPTVRPQAIGPEDVDPDALSEAELDWLDRFLTGPESTADTMSLEVLDGFLTALAIGPVPSVETDWLPAVWGERGAPRFADDAQERFVLALIRRHAAVTAGRAARGRPADPYIALMSPSERPLDWAIGFLEGVDLADEAWQPLFDEPDADDLIGPIEALADEGSDPEDGAFEALPDVLAAIGAYWRRPPRVPARSTKVGRNDPCPCGSGKKYKKCHGANA